MHVTFGSLSNKMRNHFLPCQETVSLWRFIGGHSCDTERVLHINLSRHHSFSDNVCHHHSDVVIFVLPCANEISAGLSGQMFKRVMCVLQLL